MSKIKKGIIHAVFHTFYILILGETDGNFEKKTGKTKTFTDSEQVRFRVGRLLVNRANKFLLWISGGLLGNSFLGLPLILITTIGRKTGKPRKQPVFFMREGARFLLVASNSGAPTDPVWLLNVKENPQVLVDEKRKPQRRMRAKILSAEEKANYWPALTAMFPMWQEIEDRSPRKFSVVMLESANDLTQP
ncbi:MAG TPA: nitroreductase/quinone reductase family protein [Rhodocyclaceae bacterium]|jgi:deazaflavin-dependent oxidoreductase (nitroreductase family)|nr:nitroreductase/quinone reductase family protein [Rhodocyclaceae bacterium]